MIATLTSKGQVTIPKKFREIMHLHAGDKLDFFITDEGEIKVVPVTKKSRDGFGILSKHTTQKLTIDEMNDKLKERFKAEK